MKKNAGKITLAVLFLVACIIIVHAIMPAFAVVRSYDNDVHTVTISTVMTATSDQMFTVSGGPIEIVSLFGQCTTALAGSPGDMTIEVDATDGTDYDNDFSTTVTVDTVGAGDVITFTNAVSEGVLTFVANQNAGQTLSWFCPEGEIEQLLTSTGTGAIEWFMSYRKLTSASTAAASVN